MTLLKREQIVLKIFTNLHANLANTISYNANDEIF